ncbi:MAG: choice-of-anchor Q domain-containing protein, partial [Ginsengibacter sp.]
NTAEEGGGVYAVTSAIITNSTISGNKATFTGGVHSSSINIAGSIVALNSGGDLALNTLTDGGYNIFTDVPSGTVSTDQTGATSTQLNLGALANNGGSTLTMLPGTNSIAIGKGNPTDETTDQRGRAWFSGTVRTVGAVDVQTTLLVKNANDAGAGSLRAAVSSAIAGDTIRIDGTNSNFLGKGIITITLTSGDISFATDNLVFKGFYNAAGDTVKVSGNHASVIINTSAPTLVTVDSMYLINGNSAGLGGAVYNSTGAVTILNSTISGNTATQGGGGVSTSLNANAIIINSTISGNTGRHGGGIFAHNLTITNSTISGNTATLSGAGIYANGGIATITNSTISGNKATNNGGGGVDANDVNISNSTISGNTATQGGGVYAVASAIITNSTISGNTATNGGGIEVSSINITGSIVALNNGGDLYNSTTNNSSVTTDGGYNIFTDVPTGTVSSDQTGATSVQLNLGALANNGGSTLTMLPGAGSNAIGKGNPTDETTDQRGVAWVPGTVRSVGAVNFAALSTLPVKLLSFSGSSINNQAVRLNWVTATETNNKGFAVLRSTDNGETFEQIAFVNSFAPNGNSDGILSYTYTDNTPSNGKNFYRLKQIDLDGNYTYSNVVSVELSTQIQLLISPNPTSGTLNVQGAAAGSSYKIFDIMDQPIKKGVFSNTSIDVSGLSAGAYILQIENITGQTQTAKFVKE